MSISLLVPCYNAATYLPDLAASIGRLEVEFDEILCYDDGSSDDTIAVAKQLGLPVVVGGVNRGVASARNRLLEHATGEWLHFQDADDPMNPEFLTVMRPLLRPDTDVAICDADWIDVNSGQCIIAWRHFSELLQVDPLLSNLRMGVSCNCMIIRRQSLVDIGGFDESMRMWEDADLHIRLAAAGARYESLGTVASISLRRDSSFSHDYRASWNCRLAALEKYAVTLPDRVIPEVAEQAEIAARTLLGYHDKPAAKRALALNHRLGGHAPVSRNPAIRVTHALFGAWSALRLQEYLRRKAA